MPVPLPTPIYRLVHVDNLTTLLERGRLHSPTYTPDDGLPYKTIHKKDVQASRRAKPIPCGPGGSAHDYVPFYFGSLSVMLLNLKTGRVDGYDEGQEPLLYLVSSAQTIAEEGRGFVFTDGHGLAKFTDWYDDLKHLKAIDWEMVGQRYWADTPDDNDRQRRKQAEFLAWRSVRWSMISEIGVFNQDVATVVDRTLDRYPRLHRPGVNVRRDWYYY